jgi:hypothetical protein
VLSRASEHTRAVAVETLAAAARHAEKDNDELRRLLAAVRAEGDSRLGSYARKDAHDKKKTVERLLVLERTLREVHEMRAAGDKATALAIEASHMRLAQLLAAERSQREGKERKLREQVQQALLKLRAFARDLEEKQEQGRAQLEAVVRLEIRARFHAVETLQAAATSLSAKAAALETRVRGAVESDVGQLREEVLDTVVNQLLEAEVGMLELEEQMAASFEHRLGDLEEDLEETVASLHGQMRSVEAAARTVAERAAGEAGQVHTPLPPPI